MKDLIERLERAEEGSRELDLAVFRNLNPEFADEEVWRPYGGGLRHRNDGSDARCLPPPAHTPPRFTTSLDTAMTLIDADWEWSMEACEGMFLYSPLDSQMMFTVTLGNPDLRIEGEAPTAPLAFVIAALKAIAMETGTAKTEGLGPKDDSAARRDRPTPASEKQSND